MKRTLNARDSINLMTKTAHHINSIHELLESQRTPSDFAVCQIFFSPKKEFLLLPASKVSSMNASKIIEIVATKFNADKNNLSLLVKSPSNFSLVLNDDDSPFNYLNALFFLPVDNSCHTKPRNFYINITQKSNKLSHAFIPVINDKATLLYMAPLSFSYGQFNLAHVIGFLTNLHKCSADEFTAYDKHGNKITEYAKESDFIRALIFNSLYISFKPDETTTKQIFNRLNALNEFKDTELAYFQTLEGFELNIGNVLKRLFSVTKEESDSFLSSAHYIISLHEQIAKDLQEMKMDYTTMIGQWFKKYVPFLKVYNQYVSLYKILLPKFTTAMNTKTYSNLFSEFASSTYAHGLSFDSVLIIPVQRGPRYQLLLREIYKNTPKSHPDYEILGETLELTKETLKKLEMDVSLVERRQKLVQLENWFSNKITIIQPNRIYINTFYVQLKDKKYVFLLFSDEFWIANIAGDKLSLNKTYSYTSIDLIKYGNQSVVLRLEDSDRIYLLDGPKNRDLLISQFRETAMCFIQRQRDHIIMTFETIQQSQPLELTDHSMVFDSGIFWIYGGKKSKGIINGNLYKYIPEKDALSVIEYNQSTDPQPRYQCALAGIKSGLFLFGGTPDGTKELNDFWFFSFKNNTWAKVAEKGDYPPAGFGYDLQPHGDFLILSGGKHEFGIYKFALKTKEWSKVKFSKGVKISSLYGHSYVPIEKVPGTAMIIGGKKENGEFNEFPIHIAKNGEVTNYVRLYHPNPMNRFRHKCITIKDTIFCIGGEDFDTNTLALQLTLSAWTVPQIEGAKCHSLYGFALAASNDQIYIHGGCDQDGRILNTFMKATVKIPDPEGEEAELMFLDSITFERDNFVYNMIQNPKSVKDEIWK